MYCLIISAIPFLSHAYFDSILFLLFAIIRYSLGSLLKIIRLTSECLLIHSPNWPTTLSSSSLYVQYVYVYMILRQQTGVTERECVREDQCMSQS